MIQTKKNKIVELKRFLTQVRKVQFKILLNRLSSEKGIQVYEQYRKVLNDIRENEKELLHQYNDHIFMRLIKIMIGPWNDHSMEAYYELIRQRMEIKGLTMNTNEYYDYLHTYMPRS